MLYGLPYLEHYVQGRLRRFDGIISSNWIVRVITLSTALSRKGRRANAVCIRRSKFDSVSFLVFFFHFIVITPTPWKILLVYVNRRRKKGLSVSSTLRSTVMFYSIHRAIKAYARAEIPSCRINNKRSIKVRRETGKVYRLAVPVCISIVRRNVRFSTKDTAQRK